MRRTHANILFYSGYLSSIYDTVGASNLPDSYVIGAVDVLKRFDRIVIGVAQTDDEIDRTIEILTALRRSAPAVKVYGYTEKTDVENITAWQLRALAWHADFGDLLNGIYVGNFDAMDVGPAGVSLGTWTRTDQNLAVTTCHNNDYELWAESDYPELTLGPAAAGETASTLGRDTLNPEIQDAIIINAYTSEWTQENRGAGGRQAVAKYITDFAAQDGVNLYTSVWHHSPQNAPDPFASPETYVPLNTWRTLIEETDTYEIDGFGVFTTLLGDPSERRWFFTNSSRSLNFDPRSSDTNIEYCRLYGRVLPTAFDDDIPTFTLRYRRTSDEVASNPYFDRSGEIDVTPDDTGYWEVLLAASLTPGSTYKITLDNADTCRSMRKTVTLVGGTSVEY